MLYVVAYDIRDNKKRDFVSTSLLDVGMRVQYSVFETDISQKYSRTLFSKLKRELSRRTDRLVVAPAKEVIVFSNIRLGMTKNIWIV